jgi:uncharacterized protein YndB with AHSA1/START domain
MEESDMTVVTAQVSVVIAASDRQVWEALTNPNLIREYFFGTTVATDWKVGSPITFAGEWNGRPYADKGEILVFRPNEELSYSHWSPMSGTDDAPESYHVVDIALADAEGGTRVTLTQSNLTGGVTDADRASCEEYEKNWKAMLKGLKATAER